MEFSESPALHNRKTPMQIYKEHVGKKNGGMKG